MSITFDRPSSTPPPVSKIIIKTANSARMVIKFEKGVRTVTLHQLSPLSGEDRVYVWDREALLELADALTQAELELGKRG